MLETRVITALVIIPLLVSAVLLLSVKSLAFIFGVVIIIGAWEWSRLSGFTSMISRLAYIALTIFIMLQSYNWIEQPKLLSYMLYAVFVWWLFAFLWLTITSPDKLLANVLNVYIRGLIGLILLVPAWLSLLALHTQGNNGPYLLLAFFILIWVADSGAYYSGKIFGCRKLAPVISPGKTIEGVYGALCAAFLASIIIALFLDYNFLQIIIFSSITLFCIIFSIIGDLFESVAKRNAGIKDSGTFFPGHGGVMDRIDSLTSAAPLFLLSLGWFPGLV